MKRRCRVHPAAPKALIREYRALKSARRVAALHHVNPRYVHDLLTKGVTPANPTIARELHCKENIAHRVGIGDRRMRHARWWLRLTSDQRNQLIFFMYHYREQS